MLYINTGNIENNLFVHQLKVSSDLHIHFGSKSPLEERKSQNQLVSQVGYRRFKDIPNTKADYSNFRKKYSERESSKFRTKRFQDFNSEKENKIEFKSEIKIEKPKQHLSDYNKSINSLADNGKISQIDLLFDEMKKNQIKPNLISYSGYLKAIDKVAFFDVSLVKKIVADMEKNQVDPDIVIYTQLINLFGRKGDLETAFGIFKIMKDNSLKADLQLYSTLISLATKKKDEKNGLEIIETMEKDGIKPDVVIYRNLVDFYFKCGNLKKAEALFDLAEVEIFYTYEEGKTKLDLHDFFSHGCSCIALKKSIEEKTWKTLIVIPGKGKHSKHKELYELKNCVTDFVKSHWPSSIKVVHDPKNTGKIQLVRI